MTTQRRGPPTSTDMRPLTLEALDAKSAAYDRDVGRTGEIDACCSSSAWVIPAHQAFGGHRKPWIFHGDCGWLALARADQADGTRILQPLEPVWGLASPCIGGAPAPLATEVADLLASREEEWDLAVLTGLVPGGALWGELARCLARRHRLFRGAAARRYRASLAGGMDAFLGRRSRNLRRTLSRAVRAVRARGIAVEAASGPAESLFARVQAVEARSWKGLARTGLADEAMRGFYARIVPRLMARGALRLSFARGDGRDVGYILGGIFGSTYRGLQFSYDAELGALGLGNVLQLAQVEALCAEGVLLYDLGTEVAYKARWAEAFLETAMLIVER